jgi:geranylgeranyl diphosphate synthase, type II
MTAFDFATYFAERRQRVDRALERLLPAENGQPPSVHQAMRYSVMAGGKRLRPVLVIAGAEAVGGRAETVMPTACALELIHTYSLIHDDLPAMDDDDYRRGRLTNHKMFGEAIAILAGDALLTLAFELIARGPGDPRVICEVIATVAEAAGTRGMVGGQVVDIESEGRTVSADTLEFIHRHKTAALIRVSLSAGAILAGATPAAADAIRTAGDDLGLAFQIVDDILDVEGSLAELGKTAGSDERKKKVTYPALYGLDVSRARARDLIEHAHQVLAPLGPAAEPIRALAAFVVERRS